MGFFGIYKEAFEITLSRKKIFLQISRSRLLPLTILFLSSIQLSYLTGYTLDISVINAIFNLLWVLLATSTVVYTVACICTSRDITFKSAIGVFPKVGGRLFATFLWCFHIWAIYTGLVVGLFLWFFLSVNAQGQGKDKLVLITGIFLLIPFVIGLIYMENIMSVAMVISILENDVYGWKALGKSIKLIRGKICVSFAVLLPLHIAIAGLVFAFTSLLVQGLMSLMSIVRSFYVTIACTLLLMVLIHFTLVIQTIVYFVCKSYHNEDLSNFAEHLGDGYANLGGEQGDNQLQRPLV
ncbi:hypothetical protein C5167_039951 [Papaver somniferum]|uniref:Uncharacterized protein n=1 Tax=Papaver somniferum TaxID=3469 RepID=A0A4Y7IDG9_PAPSO|nr:hypothetical protein C5167_039951 [Papaver somniferum]